MYRKMEYTLNKMRSIIILNLTWFLKKNYPHFLLVHLVKMQYVYFPLASSTCPRASSTVEFIISECGQQFPSRPDHVLIMPDIWSDCVRLFSTEVSIPVGISAIEAEVIV